MDIKKKKNEYHNIKKKIHSVKEWILKKNI